jgi:RNA polymerase sigma factor (sigma-70 family)
MFRLVEDFLNQDPSSMQLLLQGCKKNDRESQRLLYQHYYGYAMSICMRYCRSYEESKEIVNDGFMKVFKKIDQHVTESSFKAWLRKIMINSAIDHYRKEVKHQNHTDIEQAVLPVTASNHAIDDLSYAELIGMVQRLSPGYRAVFNLHVIDGFTHEEISGILGISEGTSKSNLMKARENLKKMLEKVNRGGLYTKYV